MIALDRVIYDQTFRAVYPFQYTSCCKCHKEFKDREKISIALTSWKRKALCNKCAKEIIEKEPRIKVV